MKPKYTLIIKDNEKNEVLLNVDVRSYNYSLRDNRFYLHPNSSVAKCVDTKVGIDINVNGFLIDTEPEPNEYVLDEMEYSCNHEWVEYQGLETKDIFCKVCGMKK
jgi:hypothetical protein